MIERRSTMLPPPSAPDFDEVEMITDLTPIENCAVWESAVFEDAGDDTPTIPAPPSFDFDQL